MSERKHLTEQERQRIKQMEKTKTCKDTIKCRVCFNPATLRFQVCVCVRVCVSVSTFQSAHAQRHSCTGEIRLNKSEIPVSFKTLHLFTLLIIVITTVSSH